MSSTCSPVRARVPEGPESQPLVLAVRGLQERRPAERLITRGEWEPEAVLPGTTLAAPHRLYLQQGAAFGLRRSKAQPALRAFVRPWIGRTA
jgi:hypothetical protein